MSKLELPNLERVREINPKFGFMHDDFGLLKPYLILVDAEKIGVVGVMESGHTAELAIDDVPYMNAYASDVIVGALAILHHRKGGQTHREPHRRLLRMQDSTAIVASSRIFFGEHKDHVGEVGFFLSALHIGNVLDDETEILPEELIVQKYFPIGAAAEGNTSHIL